MRTFWLFTSLIPLAFSIGCKAGGAGTSAPPGGVSLMDPTGDDNGPGTYVYPTDQVYKPGSFDITSFEVVPKGDTVEFRVTVKTRIEDPWDSKAWGGNGFSLQMAFIHIDTDHVPGSGATTSLPGNNVRFSPEEAWDKVVIISPQGTTRLVSEVETKVGEEKSRVVIPKSTRAAGRTLIAIVDAAQLGGLPQPGWGYQVLMQSNEGFPDKADLLTRKVNEFEGQHRFGGGTDYDNDPHSLDILVPPGKGGADEVQAQHEFLSKYNNDATAPTADDLAVVPMVYPGR
jgi:hypothetical protein